MCKKYESIFLLKYYNYLYKYIAFAAEQLNFKSYTYTYMAICNAVKLVKILYYSKKSRSDHYFNSKLYPWNRPLYLQ